MNDRRIKILLVDDDEDYWVIIRSLLSESKDVHYELDWIADYDAALETIKLNKHDIYLLDYRIGYYTGLDILSTALENDCKVPFIMLTGQDDRETDVKAMEMGASDYLIKDKIDAVLLDRSIRYAIERKKNEDYLRNSAQEWQTTFDAISDGVIVLDVNGEIQRCNLAMTEIIGKPSGEVIRRKYREVIPGGSKIAEGCLFSKAKATGKRETSELEFLGKKYQCFIDLIRNDQGSIVGGVGKIMDITEHRKLEEQLLQSQRLEAIGQLAGGIAHDFNNLMTSVLGYSSLILSGLAENDVLRGDIEEIHKAGKRASLLTQQLLAFSRKQPLKVQLTDLNNLVGDMEKMLRMTIGEDIALLVEREAKNGNVKVDPGQLEQVLMNLTLNARDAMPGGGQITIRTENVNISGKESEILPGARTGRFVCFSIQDTGIGMDKEIINHIFEPFFTTKDRTKGTGLGLSTSYGIIAQHEGWINVESEPNNGSLFKVYLPVVNTGIEKEIIEENAVILNEYKGNGEQILVVEDEEDVRKFVCRLLIKTGYGVCEASDAGQAVEIFKRDKGNCQLIFSDMVLPDKNGLQLVEELVLLKPDLPVVLASGYTDEKSQLAVVQKKGLRFLQKPYPASLLLKTIKELLKPK